MRAAAVAPRRAQRLADDSLPRPLLLPPHLPFSRADVPQEAAAFEEVPAYAGDDFAAAAPAVDVAYEAPPAVSGGWDEGATAVEPAAGGWGAAAPAAPAAGGWDDAPAAAAGGWS